MDSLRKLLVQDWCVLSQQLWEEWFADLEKDEQILAILRESIRFDLSSVQTRYVTESMLSVIRQGQADSLVVHVEGRRWLLLEELGKGAFGQVWLASPCEANVAPDDLAAIKIPLNEKALDLAPNEIDKLSRLPKCRYIAQFLGADIRRNLLITSFIDGPTLSQEISRCRRLSAATAVGVGLNIGEAISNIHKQGWIHKDVKPGNIILDQERQAVLVDFGFTGKPRLSNAEGTPQYIAPELYAGRTAPTPAADVFSLCATLYAASVGFPPFFMSCLSPHYSQDSRAQLDVLRFNSINQITSNRISRFRPDIPGELCDLIANGLLVNPTSRIPLRELMVGLRRLWNRLRLIEEMVAEAEVIERQLWLLVTALQRAVREVIYDPSYGHHERSNAESIGADLANIELLFRAVSGVRRDPEQWRSAGVDVQLVRDTIAMVDRLSNRKEYIHLFLSDSPLLSEQNREVLLPTLVPDTLAELRDLAYESLGLAHRWRDFVASYQATERSCEPEFNTLPTTVSAASSDRAPAASQKQNRSDTT
ncbi:MAG: serine/threonine protein kinase [Planctomycetales bacterium]|nr:serine/threonine protein kinase [Planctomycetales bacterium]